MRSEHKKHIKQMDEREKRTVARLVSTSLKFLTPRNIGASYHCKEQMTKRLGKFDTSILHEVVTNSKFVEYKQVWENGEIVDKRVVLRSEKVYEGDYNYCVVYSLRQRKVITFWKNRSYFTHENVDLSQYHGSMLVY